MALDTVPLPFGLREVKVAPLSGDTPGTEVKFPNSRTFSFSEAEDYEDLRGDDALVATHGKGPQVDWQLEGGGFSFEAVKVMYGGTITETGTTPNIIKAFDKNGTDSRPYFQVRGRAISDSGGDFTITLYKCKATGELSGEMSEGQFWLTGASGVAMPNDADRLYTFTQKETAAELSTGTPDNEVQTLTEGGSGLTSFTVTFDGQTTGSLDDEATAAQVEEALEALSNIGEGNVSVTRTGSVGSYVYTVTFINAMGGTNQPTMSATPTGGTGTVTVATLTPGG